MNETNTVPNPGSIEARNRGCTCPILDNARGQGFHGSPDHFVITAGCPVHGSLIPTRPITLPDDTRNDHG